jgi:8-oxo-dGTP diphosphatase
LAPPNQPPRPQFFSGFVAELNDTSLTVSRKLSNKDVVSHVFLRDRKTKIEGSLKIGARVTVGYESSAAGDRAVHIIVRG